MAGAAETMNARATGRLSVVCCEVRRHSSVQPPPAAKSTQTAITLQGPAHLEMPSYQAPDNYAKCRCQIRIIFAKFLEKDVTYQIRTKSPKIFKMSLSITERI